MNYRRLYIQNTKIFITVVTSKRRDLLIQNIDILRQAFKEAKQKFSFDIDSVVILPNHLHMIISPKNINEYPEIIRKIKSYFSRNIDISQIDNYEISESKKNKGEKDIWQRRYWEHTIQNEAELNQCRDYIHYNPVKHKYVNKAKDWEYSSFRQYVEHGLYDENWCNFEETSNLSKFVYE